MKRFFFLAFLITIFQWDAIAQRRIPQELRTRLTGKTKVADIMAEVESYYDNGNANIPASDPSDFESNDYEWWKKWEYWATRRLLPDGRLADHRARNYLAKQETESKFGLQMRSEAAGLRSSRSYAPGDYTPERDINAMTAREDGSNLSYGFWTSIGPTSGGLVVGSGINIDINGVARMDRVTFHPTDPNTFYTCSPSGGIYKTTNGGSTWSTIGDGLPGGVACMGVAPSNGNVVYAFSGDGDSHQPGYLVFDWLGSPISRGVYKSIDGGNTWTKLTNIPSGGGDLIGHQIAISLYNSDYLFIATNQGLFRTTNGGISWTQVRTGEHWDVEFKPGLDSTVYTSTATTVHYSTQGGRLATWNTSSFNFSPASTRIDLAVRKDNSGAINTYVYALAGEVTAPGQFRGLFLSTNSGANFTRQCNTPNILGSETNGSGTGDQTPYDMGICVKPNDAMYVVTGGLCVWRSNGSNGGTSMVYSTTYREGNGPLSAYIHPDIHDVQYNPINNYLYAATDGGLYRSTDNGVTWTNLSLGLSGTQFYHMSMADADGDGEVNTIAMVGGAQDNGIKYRNTSGTWHHTICCDGFGTGIKGEDPQYLVVTINGSGYRTPNGGVNMTYLGSNSFFSPMAVDYDNDDTMYMGSSSMRRSVDGFVNYTATGFNRRNFVTTCPSNNARIYGGSSSNTDLFRSEDRGNNWTTISGTPGWPAGARITDCKPYPLFSNEIYASFAGYTNGVKVYRSIDAGASWTNYSGSLPNLPIHSLCVAIEGIYVGTEIGVFFRQTGGADWQPFYTGMPNVSVTDIWVNEDNGLVYASTFGRGVWISDRFSACNATITVSGLLDGPYYYEASSIANVTATSTGSSGTEIFVKSNGYVDLLPGFDMKAGTFFKAYLGPCGTGGIPTTGRGASLPFTRSIIEYDMKDQAKARKSPQDYYSLKEDGVEININSEKTVTVEIMDVKTSEVKTIINNYKLYPGMYRILTGAGNFSVRVLFDGKLVQKLD